MPRMLLLSNAERILFDNPPKFTDKQREYYFSITPWTERLLQKLRTPTTKAGFVLLLGYFKATSRFFEITEFHSSDIHFVTAGLKIGTDEINVNEYIKKTFRRHQKIILEHFGCQRFKETDKSLLSEEVKKLVSRQIKPKQIFLSLLDLLQKKKIEIPTYHALSEIIRTAVNGYEDQLLTVVNKKITSSQKRHLDGLYETDKSVNGTKESAVDKKKSKKNRYKFTMLKRINQSIHAYKIKENIQDLQTLQPIYLELNTVIKELALSTNSIEYYAVWAKKAQIFQLLQKDRNKRYLHSIAFVIYQYFSLQDALIDKLRLAVQRTVNAANKEHQMSLFENRKENSKKQNQLIKYVKHHQSFYSKVEQIMRQKDLTNDQKIISIEKILSEKNNPPYLTEEEILFLEKENQQISRDDKFYNELESLSISLQKKVSDIIRFVRFDPESSDKKILSAITYYKEHYKNLRKKSPTSFLEWQEKKLIFYETGKFRVSLYKALLFKHTAEAIKGGSLNIKDSHRYKSLDEYLIEKTYWENNKEKILEEADLLEFRDIDKVIRRLEKELDDQYHITNKHILDGSNKHITFKDDGKFILKTPKVEKKIEGTLSELFPQNEYISRNHSEGAVIRVQGAGKALKIRTIYLRNN